MNEMLESLVIEIESLTGLGPSEEDQAFVSSIMEVLEVSFDDLNGATVEELEEALRLSPLASELTEAGAVRRLAQKIKQSVSKIATTWKRRQFGGHVKTAKRLTREAEKAGGWATSKGAKLHAKAAFHKAKTEPKVRQLSAQTTAKRIASKAQKLGALLKSSEEDDTTMPGEAVHTVVARRPRSSVRGPHPTETGTEKTYVRASPEASTVTGRKPRK